MKQNHLADYFVGVGAKRLTLVEVNPERSNQHEFQGVADFKKFLGETPGPTKIPTTYLRLSDEREPEAVSSSASWSDVRRNKPQRSPEFHLYYPSDAEALVHKCDPDDLLVVAKRRDGSLAIIMAPQGSTSERQLLWLFALDSAELDKPQAREFGPGSGRDLDIAAEIILEALGVEIKGTEDAWLGKMIENFGGKFPSTARFSEFARATVPEVTAIDDPDAALLAWMSQEELLFRTFERHLVAERVAGGFELDDKPDVDGFISYSLSVQNRRKSRAGYAFGNQFETLLIECKIQFTRESKTEGKSRPDFLFPGQEEYHQPEFPVELLSMLAAKTSCKDRWRQVLVEADRVENKHLLTLEPGISIAQTDEMKTRNLQLVVPRGIHGTYEADQQAWLMDVTGFIQHLRSRI